MSSELSVLMLTASFHPHIGGTERQALELSKSLIKSGARVLVVTRRRPGLARRETVQGVEVRRLFAPGSGFVNSLCFLCSSFWFLLFNGGRYSVIHVHLASSPALAACLAGKLLGKRVVVKIGGGRGIGEIAVSLKTLSGRLKLRLLAWLRPQLVAVDAALLPELERGGLSSLPCAVVPNGVDCAVFSPPEKGEKAALRARFGFAQDRLVFLFAGRLAREKMLCQFIELWKRSGACEKALFAIAGGGPLEQELKKLADELGLGESVRFLGAAEDMPSLYRSADVFVLPSIAEGLSNAMLEAMSCGLAVLATKEGGAASALGDSGAGFLFDPRDAEGIISGIGRFIFDPGLCKIMGEAARRRAVESYSLERVVARLADIYKGSN